MHRLTASMAYMTTRTYESTNDQWARPAFSLVVVKNRVSPVQFSYVALYAAL